MNVATRTITVIPTMPTTRIERPVYQYENDLEINELHRNSKSSRASHVNGESPMLDLIPLLAVPSSPSAEEKSEIRWT